MRQVKPLRIDVLTLFPGILENYFQASILGRGQKSGKIILRAHDIRAFATDKHNTVDNTPYGGGAGMVLMAEPILKCVAKVIKEAKSDVKKRRIIIMSAKGKQFNQKLAAHYSQKFEHLILIAGRYEGIDERVKTILKAEEISVGPYVMTDGDVAAMAIVSAVARLVPGVIRLESLAEESHWQGLLAAETKVKEQLLEYPHYTRPEVINWKGKKYRVPRVLLSGNHAKIRTWRVGKQKAK
jgi:tRNA (guanine37-N1)-methyltransferase